jgi:hypothetical protein
MRVCSVSTIVTTLSQEPNSISEICKHSLFNEVQWPSTLFPNLQISQRSHPSAGKLEGDADQGLGETSVLSLLTVVLNNFQGNIFI